MPNLAVPDGGLDPHPQPASASKAPPRGHKNHGKRQRKHQHSHPPGPPDATGQGPPAHVCYNCGSPDHFIQHCPERRQDGYSGSHRHPHPPKRQKTSGSLESHYRGSSSSHKQRSRPQRGFTHPPPPDYHQMPNQGLYEPPPGPYPPQHHDPWHPPPSQPYGYPYGPHEPPYPSSSYGPSYPSPRGAHGPMHGQQDYFPPPYARHSGERDHPPYQSERRPPPPRESRRGHAREYWSRYDNIRPIAPTVEPWMEDLDMVEIPEPRQDPNQIVWRPPQPVARPLPSTLTDRDEITMPPPLASLPRGMSISKYILDKKAEEFTCNIRDTEDWPFIMDDPIFMEIPADGKLISIKELLAIQSKVYETHRVERPSTPEPKEDESEEINEEDNGQVDEEEAHDDDSYASGSDRRYDDDSRSYASSEVQDEPASPVSGKAIELNVHEQLRDEDDSEHSEENDTREKSNGRPWPRGRNNHDHVRHSDPGRDSEFSSRKQQASNRRVNNNKPQPWWRPRPQHQHQLPPPPPPPKDELPPSKKVSMESKSQILSGHSTSTGHDNDQNGQRQGTNINKIKSEARHEHREPRGHAQAHRNSHKRVKAEDPDSDGNEPRRQVDDVTPRMKRRQPQVADAYSRRW
ncbi:uncharacterized protein CIMG_09140 [Coccidioides immitis RS]|uniref:CCHC-type domain-containing protein n=1 Tax=Coccidioides immitis (strain RS) TaxID=246410 RepID=J3K1Q1_COCIM|nr:uncharacterized protein CIMG_09140 [Coccidioides immitis RS]EAS27936.3 hypothetical protein CIMG_09140 [Coccidioides immitis RS]